MDGACAWATPIITASSPPPASGCRCAAVVHVPMCRDGEAIGGADEALPSTARVHRCARRRGGLAARGARAEGGNLSDRVLELRVARIRRPPTDGPPARFEPSWLR